MTDLKHSVLVILRSVNRYPGFDSLNQIPVIAPEPVTVCTDRSKLIIEIIFHYIALIPRSDLSEEPVSVDEMGSSPAQF